MPTTLPAGTSTYKDYLAISDDERHELLNGELVMVPSPSYAHQAVQTRLSWRLAAFVETHDLGECLNAPLDVFFSEHDVVQPDIVFIARNRRADMIRTDGKLHGAPDLVVEVLSPTAATDRGTKHDLYERHGVPGILARRPRPANNRAARAKRQRPRDPSDPRSRRHAAVAVPSGLRAAPGGHLPRVTPPARGTDRAKDNSANHDDGADDD